MDRQNVQGQGVALVGFRLWGLNLGVKFVKYIEHIVPTCQTLHHMSVVMDGHLTHYV